MTSSNDQPEIFSPPKDLAFRISKNYDARDDGHYVRLAGDKNATELNADFQKAQQEAFILKIFEVIASSSKGLLIDNK